MARLVGVFVMMIAMISRGGKGAGNRRSAAAVHCQRSLQSMRSLRSVQPVYPHRAAGCLLLAMMSSSADNVYKPRSLEILDVDGQNRRVNYIEEGEGLVGRAPIVMLGGTAQTIGSYLPHIQFIRKTHKLFIIEMRGQGQTELLSEYSTIAQEVKDLHLVIEALQISKTPIDLAGFSFGGRVALAYSAIYPQQVHKLSLTGVALQRSATGKLIIQSWVEALQRGNVRDAAWSFILNGYSEAFLAKIQDKAASYVNYIANSNDPVKLLNLIKFSHSAVHSEDPYSPESSARRISCPVQIMAAQHDRIAGYQNTLDLQRILTQSVLEEFNTGHLAPFENPILWSKSLLKFFDE